MYYVAVNKKHYDTWKNVLNQSEFDHYFSEINL